MQINRVSSIFRARSFSPLSLLYQVEDPSSPTARFALKFRRTPALLVNLTGVGRMVARTKDRKGRHRENEPRRGEKRGRETGGHRDIDGDRGWGSVPVRDTFRVTRLMHETRQRTFPLLRRALLRRIKIERLRQSQPLESSPGNSGVSVALTGIFRDSWFHKWRLERSRGTSRDRSWEIIIRNALLDRSDQTTTANNLTLLARVVSLQRSLARCSLLYMLIDD